MSRAWHVAALLAFALAALIHTHAWFDRDRMPLGDFPGYVAQVQYVRDALLEHGRVPFWCIECYGGTTNFTPNLKEYLAFPLAVAFDPVVATKLLFALLRGVGAMGLYWLVARELEAPAVGIAAGYAYSYGAIANYQIEHLDVALATALLPFLWISAASLWRRGGARWAIALGVLMASQLANNWVHAATAPLAVLGLALVRPWRSHPGEPARWRDAEQARRFALRGLAAFAVFCAFAASSTAWFAGDVENHVLMPTQTIETQREFYIERSPFLFVNRDDVLAPWLAEHHPPYPAGIVDRGNRYLGMVLLAVILAGSGALRGDAVPRRWALFSAAAFLLQYWLALGPKTLLWEVATSLHWTPDGSRRAEWALCAAAALCAPAGAALAAWGGFRSDHRAAIRRRAALLFGAAVLLFIPTASLWSACARWIPVFAVQRSPGHFFDTAPFALSLWFAACLAALARRISRPGLSHALVAAVAAALVLDYYPSTHSFETGLPRPLLRAMAALVADLPADGGTRRIGLGEESEYFPIGSWVLAQSRAGHAGGWIAWQAGTYWRDSYILFDPPLAKPEPRRYSERYAPLLRAARVSYVMLLAHEPALQPPWRRARSGAGIEIWEQPEVSPIAAGYRAWSVWNSARGGAETIAAANALRANALLVAPPDDAAAADALRADASRASASDRTEPPPLLAVDYRRPAPERIQLALEAGDAPALVFVSEGYHPWWRAEVDGRPAPVLRASLAHMAVPVGPGRHTIELQLVRPTLVAAADRLTAAAWVALALGAAIAFVQKWNAMSAP